MTGAASVAVFDLDHTLSRRDTFLAYLLGFLARHPARWPASLILPAAVLWHKSGRRDNHWLKRTFIKTILGGLEPRALETRTNRFVAALVARGLWRRGLETLERHRRAGDRLVLASASPDLYVEPLAAVLGFDLVICTRLAVDPAGRITGELDGGNCYGPAKLARLAGLLEGRPPEARLTVYSDHHSDLGLLRVATHPVAVNPTPALRRQALAAGMPIEDWRAGDGLISGSCRGFSAPGRKGGERRLHRERRCE